MHNYCQKGVKKYPCYVISIFLFPVENITPRNSPSFHDHPTVAGLADRDGGGEIEREQYISMSKQGHQGEVQQE